MKRFGNVSIPITLKLFDAKIVPILLYRAELWGLGDIPKIENVANNFYRRLLGMRRNSPVTLVRGELGRLSMAHMARCRVLKYWMKILKCNESRAI